MANNLDDSTQELNHRQDQIAPFWLSDKAFEYSTFANEVIPSNRPSIAAAHSALIEYMFRAVKFNGDLQLLDFGSYQGASSGRLLNDVSRAFGSTAENIEVTGVDCVEEFVAVARDNYGESPALHFVHSAQDSDLIIDENGDVAVNKFHGATMFFVDQVIPNNITLLRNYKKVYESLLPGSPLVILRLAQESFGRRNSFLSYRHNKHVNPRLEVNKFRRPEPFVNELLLPLRDDEDKLIREKSGDASRKSLEFVDYFRDRKFITALLTNGAGFSHAQAFPLTLGADYGGVFTQMQGAYTHAFRLVQTDFPEIINRSDGKIPLHEIIVAIK